MVEKIKSENLTEDLLTNILGHCYEISTQTNADAFFEYAPHTSEITIRIYPDGWSAEADCEYIRYRETNSIYFNNEDGTEMLEYALEQLDKLLDKYKREMNPIEEVKT